MQKDNAKVEKISIFNSLDVKLEFLTSWVELIQFSVELSWIELKICSIWLKLSWKCEQLNFESSWIQNVNLKLNLMISLFKSFFDEFLHYAVARSRCDWFSKQHFKHNVDDYIFEMNIKTLKRKLKMSNIDFDFDSI